MIFAYAFSYFYFTRSCISKENFHHPLLSPLHFKNKWRGVGERKEIKQKTTQGGFLFNLKSKFKLVFSASASSPITSSVIASTSWWASFHWASFVDSKFASFEFLIVEHRDSFCSFILR